MATIMYHTVEGDRGGSTGEQGAWEGGKRENKGREAGAEIKKAIVAIEHPPMLKRKFWKQENLNLYSGWKNSITTSGEFGNPFHSITS